MKKGPRITAKIREDAVSLALPECGHMPQNLWTKDGWEISLIKSPPIVRFECNNGYLLYNVP